MNVFEALTNITLVLTPLILFILLITPLADKRYAAGGRYVLWMLIMLGLCLPLVPFSPPKTLVVDIPSPILYETSAFFSALNGASAANTAEKPAKAVLIMPTKAAESHTIPAATTIKTGAFTWQAGRQAFDFPFILIAVWLAGILFSIAYYIINHLLFIRFVNRWREAETNPGFLQVFETERLRLGISKKIPLERCRGISAPMLVGFFDQRVLIPDIEFDCEDLPFIFRHELTHYKRFDLWYKLALTVIKCVHWFNPVTGLMIRQANKDIETICDSLTVNGMDIDFRKKYSEVILCMASGPVVCRSRLTTCMNGGRNMLRQRFTNILGRKKKSGAAFFILMGISVLFMVTMVGFKFSPADFSNSEGINYTYIPATEAIPDANSLISNKNYYPDFATGIVQDTIDNALNALEKAGLTLNAGNSPYLPTPKLFDTPVPINESYQGISEITIKTSFHSVVISHVADFPNGIDERALVSYYEWFDDHFTVTFENGRLNIIENDWAGMFAQTTDLDLSAGPDKYDNIYINLPSSTILEAVSISTVNGWITLNHSALEGAGVSLSTLSGDISVNNGYINGGVSALSTSGNVTIHNISVGGGVSAGTASGNVLLINNIIYGGITMDTVSGDAKLSKTETDGDITVNAATGTAEIINSAGRSINMVLATGYAKVYDSNFTALDISNTTGSTDVDLLNTIGEYNLEFITENGRLFEKTTARETTYTANVLINRNAGVTIKINNAIGYSKVIF